MKGHILDSKKSFPPTENIKNNGDFLVILKKKLEKSHTVLEKPFGLGSHSSVI